MTTETTLESPSAGRSRAWPKIAVFYGLIAATILACWWCKPPSKASVAGVSLELPTELMGFTGKDQEVSEAERVMLPKDTEFVKKLYTDSLGETINMQIVLTGVDRRSIHRPEICLSGQGWTVRSAEVVPVALESGKTMSVMVLDIVRKVTNSAGQKSELSALYAYWFVSADAETPYHLERLARTNLDLLLHNKAHRWAYVIVMAPILKGYIRNGKDRAETLAMIKDFIRAAVPTFQKSEMAVAQNAGPTTKATATR